MYNSQPLDLLPIWSVFVLTVIILLLALEAGFRIDKIIQRRWPDSSKDSVATLVGAALALLGFLLAFATSIASDNFNERRQLVIREANAIGTAYLRAGYLAEPYGEETRQLLREYVKLRLDALDTAKTVATIARSEEIHDVLWNNAEELARKDPGPTIALYLSSVNEVIDLHTERLNAELGFRVPPTILLCLYCVAVMTMILIGLRDGYNEKRNLIALVILVLMVSVVFIVIVGLDRSNTGLLQIPQKALIDLQERLISAP